MSFLVSDILPTILKLVDNEKGDLGDDEDDQNSTIFGLMNVVMKKRARQAYIVEFSDALTLDGDDDYTFQLNGTDITNLYEPLGIYITDKYGRTIRKRTSFEDTSGWIREASNQQINIRGFNGDHVLKYLRYAADVDASTDTIEFPEAAQWDIIMDVVALCKLPKNFYSEFDAIKKESTGTATVKAAIAAKGSNSAPPSMADREE